MRTRRRIRLFCLVAVTALVTSFIPTIQGTLADGPSPGDGNATPSLVRIDPTVLGTGDPLLPTAPILVTEAAADTEPPATHDIVTIAVPIETSDPTAIPSVPGGQSTPPVDDSDRPADASGDVGTPLATGPSSVVVEGATPNTASSRKVSTPAGFTAAFTEACTPGANKVLTGCVYNGEDLGNADFSGSILTGATFNGANLPGANFSGATLTGATFDGANLACADFSQANVTVATFDGANLLGADFSGAVLTSATFGESTTCPDGTMSGANGNSCLSNLVSDVCATPSPTASTTVDATATVTVDTTVTASPDATVTVAASPTDTVTLAPTESAVASATVTGTFIPAETGTATTSVTSSPTPSQTPTASSPDTATATGTAVATSSPTSTATTTQPSTVTAPSATPTATIRSTPTPTGTATGTPTPAATATRTPTAVATILLTQTPTRAVTPTADAPSVNGTASPTGEATGTRSVANAASTGTVTPDTAAKLLPNTGDGASRTSEVPAWWAVMILASGSMAAAAMGWSVRRRRR